MCRSRNRLQPDQNQTLQTLQTDTDTPVTGYRFKRPQFRKKSQDVTDGTSIQHGTTATVWERTWKSECRNSVDKRELQIGNIKTKITIGVPTTTRTYTQGSLSLDGTCTTNSFWSGARWIEVTTLRVLVQVDRGLHDPSTWGHHIRQWTPYEVQGWSHEVLSHRDHCLGSQGTGTASSQTPSPGS